MKNARPPKEASALSQRRNDTAQPGSFPDLLLVAPAPILPRPGTVKADALDAIIAGKVTQAEFRRSWRLAAYIEDLIEDGWSVGSEWVMLPGSRDPIKCFWIDLQDPATRAAVAAYKRRSGRSGFIGPELAGLLAMGAVAGLMLLGGV